jgi:hypothetical protein
VPPADASARIFVYGCGARAMDNYDGIVLVPPNESAGELAVEDAIKAHQRPKLEFYGQTMFLVLKAARYVDAQEAIEFGEIQVFVGDTVPA